MGTEAQDDGSDLGQKKGPMKVREESNERHRHFRRTKNRDKIEMGWKKRDNEEQKQT